MKLRGTKNVPVLEPPSIRAKMLETIIRPLFYWLSSWTALETIGLNHCIDRCIAFIYWTSSLNSYSYSLATLYTGWSKEASPINIYKSY